MTLNRCEDGRGWSHKSAFYQL